VLRTQYDPRSERPRRGAPAYGTLDSPPRRPYAQPHHTAAYPAPDAFYDAPDAFDDAPDAFYDAPDAFDDAPDGFAEYPDQAEDVDRTDDDLSPVRKLGPLGYTVIAAVILFTFGAGAAAFALYNVQPTTSGPPPAPRLTPVQVPSEPALPPLGSDPQASASAAPNRSAPGTNGQFVPDTRREQELAVLVAQASQQAGCRDRLRLDGKLRESARAHSIDMASRDFFSQTGSDNSSPTQRMGQAGYDDPAAENIARGGGSPRDIVQGWLNNANSRRNMLDCGVRAIGVGFATRAGGDSYWTLDLGH
jgi:uncharacterized protein YkwD